jgi:uncharacterized protein (DUF1697 family)
VTRWVALLYSIILSPDRRVQRPDLMDMATGLGFSDARSVLSTGNLVFRAPGDEASLTHRIEAWTAEHWGKAIPVLVRRDTEFQALRAANPFADEDPARVAVRILRDQPHEDVLAQLPDRCGPGEKFAARDRALWMLTGDPTKSSPLIRAMSVPRIGVGTFRNASALGKIAAALD